MTVLKVLTEVVGTKEFLGLVALAKLVHVIEVLGPRLPIGRVRKLFAAVAAHIGRCWVEC